MKLTHKDAIPCPRCGQDMRIPAKYNAENVAKLEAENEALKRRDFYQGVFIEQVLKTDPRWEETKVYKELQDALLAGEQDA